MNRPIVTGTFCLGALLAVALSGCNRDAGDDSLMSGDATPATTTPDATRPADDAMVPPVGADMQAANGQEEALALLAAVDQHEIDAARQARSKGVDGAELEYAELMEAAHSADLDATRALMVGADAGDSGDVASQKAKGEAELERLAGLEGDAYEDAYIDAMVAGHQDALSLLDNRLIPAARDDAVRAHFNTARGHVAEHLEKARALQAD